IRSRSWRAGPRHLCHFRLRVLLTASDGASPSEAFFMPATSCNYLVAQNDGKLLICNREVAYGFGSHRKEDSSPSSTVAGMGDARGFGGVRALVRRQAGWGILPRSTCARQDHAQGMGACSVRNDDRTDGSGAPLLLALAPERHRSQQ